jgi:cysteine-rich CPCC protein
VCGWEDDLVQFHDPDYRGGANKVSLNEARQNYAAFGASEERLKHLLRPPREEEIPPGSLS